MRLALAEAYRARWSNRVQDELTESLARNRPDLPRDRIERIRSLIGRMSWADHSLVGVLLRRQAEAAQSLS